MALDQSTITLISAAAVLVIGAITAGMVKVIAALGETKLGLAAIAIKQDQNAAKQDQTAAKLSDIHKDTTDAGKQNVQIISQTNGHLSDLTERLVEQQKQNAALQSTLDAMLEVIRSRTPAALVAVPPRDVRAGDKAPVDVNVTNQPLRTTIADPPKETP